VKALLAAYIAFNFGFVSNSVGELPKHTGPIEWYVPFFLLLLISVPAILGYLAGKEDAKK
jgi:hypothetical protein